MVVSDFNIKTHFSYLCLFSTTLFQFVAITTCLHVTLKTKKKAWQQVVFSTGSDVIIDVQTTFKD